MAIGMVYLVDMWRVDLDNPYARNGVGAIIRLEKGTVMHLSKLDGEDQWTVDGVWWEPPGGGQSERIYRNGFGQREFTIEMQGVKSPPDTLRADMARALDQRAEDRFGKGVITRNPPPK